MGKKVNKKHSLTTRFFPLWDTRQKQTNNIVLITFWSQFSAYSLNSIMILFLTRSIFEHGLGYDQAKAYAFIGTTHAAGYLMPMLGGFIADAVLGVRRAILLGSVLVALAYLLVALSGLSLTHYGDLLFIAAYALLPATNSLLTGTTSGMVSQIYSDDAIRAKTAMTFYYMAINVGALLATILAPFLLESKYGPLSVLAIAFLGKAIAAVNFTQRYSLYNNVIWGADQETLSIKKIIILIAYLLGVYFFILLAYSHIYTAGLVISFGCSLGIIWFLIRTLNLKGEARSKQLIALLLIVEAIVFFIIYNQMNTTLILFAKNNSDLNLFGLHISPAHYQMLNPILIIALGTQLPRFYRLFPRFTIPYQFAGGTLLAGIALLFMAFAASQTTTGYVNGNYIGLTYVLITLAELWVSAIGLSMIGLYCDGQQIAFAMGVWYLSSSLSNTISGRLAALVAIPRHMTSPLKSLLIYQHYYLLVGFYALILGAVMLLIAYLTQQHLNKKGITLV